MLPQGTSKLRVGGFYKTTYYAIQLKKKSSYHSNTHI